MDNATFHKGKKLIELIKSAGHYIVWLPKYSPDLNPIEKMWSTSITAKGKIVLQAQADGIEAIARKVIQMISTEDRIEITSPKEITLTAGGSQILRGGKGVLFKTGGKFEAKVSQHVFSGGRAMSVDYRGLSALKVYNERFSFWRIN